MYSGPEFILQLRFAQVLSMIFVTMTYSSGLPILYLVAFLSLFISYWIDKFLMLRYFRVSNQFTEANSKAVVNVLPWAAVFHFIFGYMLYSYPHIMKSNIRDDVSGSASSRYFSGARLGQAHVVVFLLAFVVVIVLLILEKPITALLSVLMRYVNIGLHKLWNAIRCKEQTEYVDENDEVIDAPDYYFEINFA